MSNLNDLTDVLKQKKTPVLTTTNDESYNWMALVRKRNATKKNPSKSKGIKGRRPTKPVEDNETKNFMSTRQN